MSRHATHQLVFATRRGNSRPRSLVGGGAVVVACVALVALAGCSSATTFDKAAPASASVALMPLQNVSGVDVTSQPGLLWSSSDVLRMFVELESSVAPLEAWPFPNVEPGALPDEVPADSALRRQLSFEPEAKVLRWQEGMVREERDRLLALSEAPPWRRAVEALYKQSRRDRVDVSALIARGVEAQLQRRGYTVHVLDEQQVPPRASFPRRVEAARRASDAPLLLLLALERWDTSHVFEASEIHVAATAALVDSTTRELIWRQSTGPQRIRLAGSDADANGDARHRSVLDLRPAYPQIAQMIVEMLFSSTP